MYQLLTAEELAEYVQLPVSSVNKWRREGKGPAYARLGRHVRYRREDVDAWLELASGWTGTARGTSSAAEVAEIVDGFPPVPTGPIATAPEVKA